MQTIKLVVAGPYHSGKSTFIESICEPDRFGGSRFSANPRNRQLNTSALDLGRKMLGDDTVLNLYGAPGQKRFAFMWEILAQGMHGLIVAVDSTSPETFQEARGILEALRSYASVPVVVAATHQDCEDAWPIEELHNALGLEGETKVLACDARDPRSAETVVNELMGMVHIPA